MTPSLLSPDEADEEGADDDATDFAAVQETTDAKAWKEDGAWRRSQQTIQRRADAAADFSSRVTQEASLTALTTTT